MHLHPQICWGRPCTQESPLIVLGTAEPAQRQAPGTGVTWEKGHKT